MNRIPWTTEASLISAGLEEAEYMIHKEERREKERSGDEEKKKKKWKFKRAGEALETFWREPQGVWDRGKNV